MRRNGIIRLKTLLLPVMILAALVLVSNPAAASWITDISIMEGPAPHDDPSLHGAYRGVYTDFGWGVTNNGQSTIEISLFTIRFDWESGGGVNIASQTTSISAGGYHDFTLSVTIPQSVALGDHKAWVNITGQKMGDPSPTTLNTFSNFDVMALPSMAVTLEVPDNLEIAYTSQFQASVTGGLWPYHYEWSFGDGSTYSYTNEPYTSGCLANHKYTSTGTYTITVTVTDSSSTPQSQTKTTTALVTGSAVASPFGSLLIPLIIISVIVAVVVVVIILMVRKPKNPVQNQPFPGQNMNPPGPT